MDIIVRTAEIKDITGILPLWEEMVLFHAQRDSHFTIRANAKENFASFIKKEIKKKKSVIFVAELQEKLVGYCLCRELQYPPVFIDEKFGEILDLAVDATERHHGVGTKLVEAAQQWFLKKNLTRIEVSVALTNEISTKFWRKVGYLPFMEMTFKDLKPETK